MKVLNQTNVEKPFELNAQAERANDRPWITFVLVDTSLQSFTVKVTVAWRFPDGDDVKAIVDGGVKKNNLSILHRNWIFASNILRKVIGGETTEKTFEENLSIMQVSNPDDPALHVLNNDRDPRFPAEFEVASGKLLVVDYKGEAKVEKPHDSIYWGVRWFYHKAQTINSEGKQVWYPWKETISRYGPGTKAYQESVWNLYQYGKEPNGGQDLF